MHLDKIFVALVYQPPYGLMAESARKLLGLRSEHFDPFPEAHIHSRCRKYQQIRGGRSKGISYSIFFPPK